MSALVDPGVDETKSTIDPHHPLAGDDDASATVDLQHPFYAEQTEEAKDAKQPPPEAGPATPKDAKPPPPEAGPVTLARLGELLRRALDDDEYHIFGGGSLHEPPVALFYDLDAWETQLRACVGAFGPTFEHAIACKSNPLALMLRRAAELGFGVECASMDSFADPAGPNLALTSMFVPQPVMSLAVSPATSAMSAGFSKASARARAPPPHTHTRLSPLASARAFSLAPLSRSARV